MPVDLANDLGELIHDVNITVKTIQHNLNVCF